VVVLGFGAHPLPRGAGLGLTGARRDSAALVRQLVSAKAQGVSPGEMKILQAYLELQNQDQSESVLFTDQTVKLFSNDQWAQRAIRKLGLLGLELVPSVRSRFAQSAMGLKP
jgi:2-octaprenyl-6-methoxyphenol hydroxylase